MTSGFFEREKTTGKLHWRKPQVHSPVSWCKSLDEVSPVLLQMVGNFCPSLNLIAIEDLYSVMFPDGKMKNTQMRSPAPYFCFWRINLHEVSLGIADVAENLQKTSFSVNQQNFFHSDFLLGFQGKLGVLTGFGNHR